MTHTKRCNVAERKSFEQKRIRGCPKGSEPALGTLEDRLSIIIRRLGGTVRLGSSGEDLNRYRVA